MSDVNIHTVKNHFSAVNDNVTVYRFENGWMVEISGQGHFDDWPTKKIVCSDLTNVLTLLEEYSKIKLA
jgi:hypothetical protein